MISEAKLSEIAWLIKNKIDEEFEEKHLTGNLKDTAIVRGVSDKEVVLEIPAQSYIFYQWWRNKAIVYKNGHYGIKINNEGSKFPIYVKKKDDRGYYVFMKEPKNHIGWINKVVYGGVYQWCEKYRNNIKSIDLVRALK